VLDEREHNVVQAARQTADKKSHSILDGAGFEVETQRTDDASEHKVVKVIVTVAVEAYQVVDVNGWDHVSSVQVEAPADALQIWGGGRCLLWIVQIEFARFTSRGFIMVKSWKMSYMMNSETPGIQAANKQQQKHEGWTTHRVID
jgi:hypothetical protein